MPEMENSPELESEPCDECGNGTYRLRPVDEYDTLTTSYVAFCARCGAAAGKFVRYDQGGDR